jgi:ABC-type glycerol-3-phosphate transport system permease component
MTQRSAHAERRKLRRSKQRNRVGVWRSAIFVICVAVAFSTLFPLVFLSYTGLKTSAQYAEDPIGLPLSPSFDNFKSAWVELGIGHYMLNSTVVVALAVIVLVVIACPAGFALSQLPLPFKRATLTVIVALMMVPGAVIMVPMFKAAVDIGLLNRRVGLVLVYAGLNGPFSVYMMTTFFRRMPKELLEAAAVDGASVFTAFMRIAVPLAKRPILTLATLNFFFLWNEFLFALLIVQTDESRNITVGLAQLSGLYYLPVTKLAAGLTLGLVPPLLVFFAFQRDLDVDVTAGAVK